MGVPEIILIIACALIVGGVIIFSVIRKKKGKPSCGCGSCNGCAGCSGCVVKPDDKKQNK